MSKIADILNRILKRFSVGSTFRDRLLLALVLIFMVYTMSGGVTITAGYVTSGQEMALIILYMIVISVGTLGIYIVHLTSHYKYAREQSLYLTLSLCLITSALLIGMAI